MTPLDIIALQFDKKPAQVVQVRAKDGERANPLARLILTNPSWQTVFVDASESLRGALYRKGIRGVDLLHIDSCARGFDVLKEINLSNLPRAILFGCANLAAADQSGARAFLASVGYGIETFAQEILAVQKPRRARRLFNSLRFAFGH